MFGFIKFLVGLVIGVAVGYIFQPQIADFLGSDQGKELVEKAKDKADEIKDVVKDKADEVTEQVKDKLNQ